MTFADILIGLLKLAFEKPPALPKVPTREPVEDDAGLRVWRAGRALGDKRGREA